MAAAATRRAVIRVETALNLEVIHAIMASHFADEERQLLTVLSTLVPDADLRELLGRYQDHTRRRGSGAGGGQATTLSHSRRRFSSSNYYAVCLKSRAQNTRTVVRLWRELFRVPARIIRYAGTIYLRLSPGLNLLDTALRDC